MLDEIFDAICSFFGNSTDCSDSVDIDAEDVTESIDTDLDTDDSPLDVLHSTEHTDFNDETSSVEAMLSGGITTSSISDTELEELTNPGGDNNGQPSFTGHTSYECTLCSCQHFSPISSGSSTCICGHSDFQHRWG